MRRRAERSTLPVRSSVQPESVTLDIPYEELDNPMLAQLYGSIECSLAISIHYLDIGAFSL